MNRELKINRDEYHYYLMSLVKNLFRGLVTEAGAYEKVSIFCPVPQDDIESEVDADIEFRCIKEFPVMQGCTSLLLYMARSAVTPISNEDIGVPYAVVVFSLADLLAIAYPRDINSGIIKPTFGGTYLGGYEAATQEFAEEVMKYRLFAGFGVSLMDETRTLLGPLLDDRSILELVHSKELILSCGRPGETNGH